MSRHVATACAQGRCGRWRGRRRFPFAAPGAPACAVSTRPVHLFTKSALLVILSQHAGTSSEHRCKATPEAVNHARWAGVARKLPTCAASSSTADTRSNRISVLDRKAAARRMLDRSSAMVGSASGYCTCGTTARKAWGGGGGRGAPQV